MTVPGDAVPVVGACYQLADPQYRYGAGPLLIRVARVIGPVEFGEDGRVEVWWEVEAYAKTPSYTGPARSVTCTSEPTASKVLAVMPFDETAAANLSPTADFVGVAGCWLAPAPTACFHYSPQVRMTVSAGVGH